MTQDSILYLIHLGPWQLTSPRAGKTQRCCAGWAASRPCCSYSWQSTVGLGRWCACRCGWAPPPRHQQSRGCWHCQGCVSAHSGRHHRRSQKWQGAQGPGSPCPGCAEPLKLLLPCWLGFRLSTASRSSRGFRSGTRPCGKYRRKPAQPAQLWK